MLREGVIRRRSRICLVHNESQTRSEDHEEDWKAQALKQMNNVMSEERNRDREYAADEQSGVHADTGQCRQRQRAADRNSGPRPYQLPSIAMPILQRNRFGTTVFKE